MPRIVVIAVLLFLSNSALAQTIPALGSPANTVRLPSEQNPSDFNFNYTYYGSTRDYQAHAIAYESPCYECMSYSKLSYEWITTPGYQTGTMYIGFGFQDLDGFPLVYEFSVDLVDYFNFIGDMFSGDFSSYIDTRIALGYAIEADDFTVRVLYYVNNIRGDNLQNGRYSGYALSYSFQL